LDWIDFLTITSYDDDILIIKYKRDLRVFFFFWERENKVISISWVTFFMSNVKVVSSILMLCEGCLFISMFSRGNDSPPFQQNNKVQGL